MKTYAVIPTKDREEMLSTCIQSLRRQVEKIVVVNTNPEGEQVWWEEDEQVIEVPCYVSPTNPPNISYWWNLGMDCADVLAAYEDEWNVLVVNDDIIAPENLVAQLSNVMRATTAVLASPDMNGNRYMFHDENSPMTIENRVTGYAWMLRGEHGMRIDEDLKWWWSDTDLEMRARREGGVVLVPGCQVRHLDPNGYTERVPELSRQAGLDRETYIRKWGSAPW